MVLSSVYFSGPKENKNEITCSKQFLHHQFPSKYRQALRRQKCKHFDQYKPIEASHTL